jgi:hypothetical protein
MGDLNVASLIKATLQGVFSAEREGDDARATSRVIGQLFASVDHFAQHDKTGVEMGAVPH